MFLLHLFLNMDYFLCVAITNSASISLDRAFQANSSNIYIVGGSG